MTPAINLENLDCMSIDPDDVWNWAESTGHGIRPVKQARELFPERPSGYVQATVNLRHYAYNKATAMRCRLRGEIQTALQYERICESIYNRLPSYARW